MSQNHSGGTFADIPAALAPCPTPFIEPLDGPPQNAKAAVKKLTNKTGPFFYVINLTMRQKDVTFITPKSSYFEKSNISTFISSTQKKLKC
jgi:hypothetical protein